MSNIIVRNACDRFSLLVFLNEMSSYNIQNWSKQRKGDIEYYINQINE